MAHARSAHWAMAIAAGSFLALSTQTTQADWLPAFTGYTIFGSTTKDDVDSAAEATVSFGVYENTSGTWIDDFGTKVEKAIVSLGGKSTSKWSTSPLSEAAKNARFVYFYEVVNTEASKCDVDCIIRELEIPVPADSVTGIGFLSGLVFNENGKPVDNRNPTLGPSVGHVPDVPGDETPSFAGFVFTGAPFTRSCGAENPLAGLVNEDEAEFFWCGLDERDFSSVVFFTSDRPPEYCPGTVAGTAHSEHCCCWSCRKCKSHGDIPCPVPEPPLLVLLITGVVAGGGWRIRVLCRRPE